MHKLQTLEESMDLASTRVLLRIDGSVPLENGRIRDDFRLRRVIPTLEFLQKKGARVLVMSHMGSGHNESVSSVASYLSEHGFSVSCAATLETAQELLGKAKNGSFVFLENIRTFPGEETNDHVFAQKLASLGEIYINDAFSVSHRRHASIVGIPQFLPSYAGMLMSEEVSSLQEMFEPQHPFLFILGGAKFDTKFPLVKKFLSIADTVYICGALSNDILKDRGLEVGISTVSNLSEVRDLIHHPKIGVPKDVKIRTIQGSTMFVPVERVLPGSQILDIGEASLAELSLLIERAETVLWNGPLGKYEDREGSWGTEALAQIIAKKAKRSVVGGGDTLAAIQKLRLYDGFTFVSTGGGAMLDFLATGTLPGIEPLVTKFVDKDTTAPHYR